MNKYEQLIEDIINEQEDKASELFHQILVEKSRDIYESLIDETDLAETGGNDVESMVDEITSDEEGMQEGEGEEVSFDGEDDGEDFGGEIEVDGDDMGDGAIEDRVMDLEDALDELKAEFDSLMGAEASEHGEEDMGDEYMGDEDMDADQDMDADEEMMYEDEEEDEEDEEEDLEESRQRPTNRKMTEAEWIREYVEKIGEFPGDQANPTGKMVGTGAKSEKQGEKNTKSPNGPGVNMGGNVVKTKGGEQDPDGKQIEQPNNEYTKNKGNLPGAGKFQNVPGAKGDSYKAKAPAAKTGEAGGTNDKSLLKHIGK